jgi:hypothetical protein
MRSQDESVPDLLFAARIWSQRLEVGVGAVRIGNMDQ